MIKPPNHEGDASRSQSSLTFLFEDENMRRQNKTRQAQLKSEAYFQRAFKENLIYLLIQLLK